MSDEITQIFDLNANIYFVVLDNSKGLRGSGGRRGKNGGEALTAGNFEWKTMAHELGHAFGLEHNFNDGAYIMSYGTASYGPEWYGPERNRLSACSAEFLAVHPYFNPNAQLENTPPTIELTSPRTYPAGAKNISIKLEVSDSEGLHQVVLFVRTSRNLHWARGFLEVKACHGLTGEKEAIVEFNYDGVIPTDELTSLSTPTTHPIVIKAVDVNGNMRSANFVLESDSPESRTSNNVPRAWIELKGRSITSVLSNYLDLVWLSLERNNITDEVELVSALSGLPNLKSLLLGNNSISDISLMASLTNLRELYLNSNNISDISAIASLMNLTKLHLSSNDISDISVLTGLTNLEWLYFSGNLVSDISALTGLTNLEGLYFGGNLVSDISALVGLTNLKALWLGGNRISDISALTGLTELTWLYLWHNSVSDISALAGLTNLTELALGGNLISDISALAGLIRLEELKLQENLILDVSALAGMTHMEYLNLDDNNISDISALANLTRLEILSLDNNSISDISALASSTKIEQLFLSNNNISDISALVNLTNLRDLRLYNNAISDISPLVANVGLGDRDYVVVWGNPLNYTSIYTHIPALQARGVRVDYNNRIPTKLVKISGDKHGSPSTSLSTIVKVQDDRRRAFEGVPVVFTLTSGKGTLNKTSTTTDKDGRAESILTLSPDLGTTTVSVSADKLDNPVTFTIIARGGVTVPDSNLRTRINKTLGKTVDSGIASWELALLTSLEAHNAGISDLTGLEFAINLTSLSLNDNNISDISAVANLTNLTSLHLRNNSISDISAVANLTNLTSLYVADNSISDISAITGLTKLTGLDLRENSISDISAVADLTHLEWLWLQNNLISDTSAVANLMNLTDLRLSDNSILNISVVPELVNLTKLYLENNNIRDISALMNLTNLTDLRLWNNSILDISALAGFTHLTELNLSNNKISDISALVNLPNLWSLNLRRNRISDISPVAGLTDLNVLYLGRNKVSDISPVANLTKLTLLALNDNEISDISAVADLTNLRNLYLRYNKISDISAVSGLTNLTFLGLRRTSTTPEFISDISPLVANTGLGNGDRIDLRGNRLSPTSIYIHLPTLTNRGVTIQFDTPPPNVLIKVSGDDQHSASSTSLSEPFVVQLQSPTHHWLSQIAEVPVVFIVTAGGGTLSVTNTMTDVNGKAESTLTLGPDLGTNTVKVYALGVAEPVTFNAISGNEYLWSVPSGVSWTHVPLKVTGIDGAEKTIESVGDVYDVLGGTDTVNYLVTHDSANQQWINYLGASDKGTAADKMITDDLGIIAVMKQAVTIRLEGEALGTDGNSTITLHLGTNLVGIPLRDSRITRVSDLLALDGIRDNVPNITVLDNGMFKMVRQPNDPGDILITGGQSFRLDAQAAATVTISGSGWYNALGTQAAPPIALKGIEIGNTTPVLALRGSIVNEGMSVNRADFRIIVKNLSTGRAVATVIREGRGTPTRTQIYPSQERLGYQLTVVDTETSRAAQIGDILEISAQSTKPSINVPPFQYKVTTGDVKRSRIQLDDVIAYEIPAETELLANYPNPFNPETWIPYRLAEDTNVVLIIYDSGGRIVRSLDVGHRKAAVYETRDKAIHWDGRNQLGERVASGVYFYHLSAGEYSATKRMVILK